MLKTVSSTIRLKQGIITVAMIFCLAYALPFDNADAEKVLYTYNDDRGQPVITDDYSSIPADRRSRVTVSGGDPKATTSGTISLRNIDASVRSFAGGILGFIGGKAIDIPGMTPQQSRILNYAGMIIVACLLGMNLSRGQGIRFLSLWCLIMTCIGTPLLLYTAQDGPADLMKKKAAQIEEKHSQRMQ